MKMWPKSASALICNVFQKAQAHRTPFVEDFWNALRSNDLCYLAWLFAILSGRPQSPQTASGFAIHLRKGILVPAEQKKMTRHQNGATTDGVWMKQMGGRMLSTAGKMQELILLSSHNAFI